MMADTYNIVIGARSRYAISANVHNSLLLSIIELTFFTTEQIAATYGKPYGTEGA